MLNTNIHAWKGLMPTVTLYESPTRFCELRPYDDRKNWQGGVEWIYKSVPLEGNRVWKRKGEVPATLNWLTIEFYPWGGAVSRLDRRHGDQVRTGAGTTVTHAKETAGWLAPSCGAALRCPIMAHIHPGFVCLGATLGLDVKPIEVQPGAPLDLRFGAALWDGDIDRGRVQAMY